MGCEIHLESLLYQMYQIPSIPPFGESQCLHEQLIVFSRMVASLAANAVASQTPALETVHVHWK